MLLDKMRGVGRGSRSLHTPVGRYLKNLSSTGIHRNTAMIVGNPFWSYPIAVADTHQPAKPLMSAVKQLPSTSRPFRIISHEATDGRVFNCSFFHSHDAMQNFIRWYSENALTPGSQFHSCLTDSISPGTELPTRDTLLFGAGNSMLYDTRFGEYQLGMAVRYSVGKFLDQEASEEVRRVAGQPSFERRIAEAMLAGKVSYFGRIVMETPSRDAWITASRYGTLEDASRGTKIVQDLLASELKRWFKSYESIIGVASRLLDLDEE